MHVFTLGTETVSLARSRYFHAVFHWRDFAEIIEFFAVTRHRREAFGSSSFFGNRCTRKYKAQRDALSASCRCSNITLLAESFEVGLGNALYGCGNFLDLFFPPSSETDSSLLILKGEQA